MSSRLFQHISALTIAVLCSLATYAQGWEEKYQNLGYIVETTRISDRDATIIMPQTPNGRWEGRQVIPDFWAKDMTSWQVQSIPGGQNPDCTEEILSQRPLENPDWCQGYGYQMWRCRNNGFRADGASSQYIIVFPDKDAVIVTTAHDDRMQLVQDILYDNILPVFK